MEVSTEVIEQSVIIFHDKSKKWVSKQQADYIVSQSCNPTSKGVTLDGSFYTFSSISKILTAKDYFSEFPEDAQNFPSYEASKEYTEDYVDDRTVEQILEGDKAMSKGLLTGLKQFIGEEMEQGRKPFNALFIYENKLKKYKERYAKS